MDVRTRSKSAVLQVVLALGIVLGCVLQQVAGALHLAQHDHLFATAGAAHVHTHGPLAHHEVDFEQRADSQQVHEDRGGHIPHPIEEHLDDGVEPAVPPALDSPVLAWAGLRATWPLPALPLAGVLDVACVGPRGPPPRGAPSSRAPPIAS